MLGEVADGQALPLLARARQRSERAGEEFDQGRFARAVASQQSDAPARRQAELDPGQHGAAVITGRGILQHKQGIGARQRLAHAKVERRIHVRRRDDFHARQCLQPALRLARLGGLGAKALDVGVQMRNLALLLLVGRLLLREMHRALRLERRVIPRIQLGPALFYREDVPDGAVEKIPVVRDREQRARIIAQPLLEPDHRIQIEVVGGFIEQQQVRAAHERARELQAHAPAAGERVHRLLQLNRCESQSVHQAGGAAARGIAAGVFVRFV